MRTNVAPIVIVFLLFSCFSILPFQPTSALKCFACDGFCDCQSGPQLEDCTSSDVRCYAVKAALSGQVVRMGCARDCAGVRLYGWQRCELCEGPLCNAAEHRSNGGPLALDDCDLEILFDRLEQFGDAKGSQRRRSLTSSFGEGTRHQQSQQLALPGFGGGVSQQRDSTTFGQGVQRVSGFGVGVQPKNEFVNGVDASAFGQGVQVQQREQLGGTFVRTFLERMSPRSVPVGFGQGVQQKQQSVGQSRFGEGVQPQPSSHELAAFGDGVRDQNDQPAPFGQGVQSNGAPMSTTMVSILACVIVPLLLRTFWIEVRTFNAIIIVSPR